MSASVVAKKKVLVVEDEAIVAMHLSELLESKGYDVVGVAANAKSTLEKYVANLPDVILMDITIKGKKDGVELAEIILAEKRAPIVFLTAHADDETLRRVQAVSPYGFILKPFKDAELCTALDIAIRRFHSERNLDRKGDFLQKTLMSMGEAVIVVDQNAQIQMMNDEAVRLTGWDKESAFLQPIDHIVRLIEKNSRQEIYNPILLSLRENRVVYLPKKTWLIGKTGVETPILDSAAPIRGEDGNVVGAVMVFYDVSQATEIEPDVRRLVEARKEEALQHIAGGIAHNYNNILAAILSNLQLLQLEAERGDASKMQMRLQRIEESAMRAAALNQQLIGYTGQGKLTASKINLNHLALTVIHRAQAWLSGAEVELALEPNLPDIRGDEIQLTHVIENLVRNAAEAITEKAKAQPNFKGKVRLGTSIGAPSDLEYFAPLAIAGKSLACLFVRDNGIGISSEHLSRIYEPFFSTKGGLFAGLGLSMAQGVVRNHGGEIFCDSKPGQGASFLLCLPAQTAGE